jgi:hypothetical protein
MLRVANCRYAEFCGPYILKTSNVDTDTDADADADADADTDA